MNKALAIAAVAGLAGTAAAQTVNISADVTSITEGGTINWTVSVTGLTAANYVQVYDFNLDASADLGTASTFATAMSAVVGPTAGTAAGASIMGASGGQSTLIDPLNAVFGDAVVGTFSVATSGTGDLSYSLSDGGVLGADIIRARTGSDLGPIAFEGSQFAVNSDTVTIRPVPTPASAALLGLGGLAAVRRRR